MWRHFHINNKGIPLEDLDETQGNYEGGNNDEEELVEIIIEHVQRDREIDEMIEISK